MTWQSALGIALLTAIAGGMASGLLADRYLTWYHRPKDIGAGILVMLLIAVGGIAGCIVGYAVSRLTGPGFGRGLGTAIGLVLGIHGIVALALYARADRSPTIGGDRPRPETDTQLPAGHEKSTGPGGIATTPEDREQAEFDRIRSDAPVSEWMPYTEPHIAPARRPVALRRITSRPSFVTELNALMVTDGLEEESSRRAAAALYLVGRREQPTPELIPGVGAAGRDLVARIRRFNASTPAQDPGQQGAIDADIRFQAWIVAADALRTKARGDFLPELREILELARLRPDSLALEGDVAQVASRYLKRWTEGERSPAGPTK